MMRPVCRAKKPAATREPQRKKTLHEECATRLEDLRQARWQMKREKDKQAHQAEEDAMMAMCYGPDWQDRTDLP